MPRKSVGLLTAALVALAGSLAACGSRRRRQRYRVVVEGA